MEPVYVGILRHVNDLRPTTACDEHAGILGKLTPPRSTADRQPGRVVTRCLDVGLIPAKVLRIGTNGTSGRQGEAMPSPATMAPGAGMRRTGARCDGRGRVSVQP